MEKIQNIAIIGSGAIAHHLGQHFLEKNIQIVQVWSRNSSKAESLAKKLNTEAVPSIEELKADLIIVCVSDQAVVKIINQIDPNQAVAYTSASIDLSEFSNRFNTGVLYPLQTFSLEKEINLFEVPFFIEANNEHLAQNLFDLCWNISRKVTFVNSEQRKHYHIAAVFVNNFCNHLFYIAQNHLLKNDLDWKMMMPLIEETFSKIKTNNPFDTQTGPAKRGDQKIIDHHLSLLRDTENEIYALMSKSILKTYINDKL